jgi:uncharacterized protein YyaL (SSP411 family)
VYLKASIVLKEPRYQQVARKTLDFMLAELKHKSGAMMASLSAIDNKGVEGGFYLWHDSLLKKLLTKKELEVVRFHWGMDKPPSLTHGHLPVIAHSIDETAKKFRLSSSQTRKLVESARKKLQAQQTKRVLPVDNKLLASWNGMALYAFSRAGSLKNGQKYKIAARGIRNYLMNQLWDGKKLYRARSAKGVLGESSLEDYAMVALGLYAYARETNNKQDMLLAKKLVTLAWKKFYHKNKGWQRTEDLIIEYGGHEAFISDSAISSSSATLIRASLLIAQELGDKSLRHKAASALNVGHKTLEREPLWFSTHIRTIFLVQ